LGEPGVSTGVSTKKSIDSAKQFAGFLMKRPVSDLKTSITNQNPRRFISSGSKRLNCHLGTSSGIWESIVFYCGGLMAPKQKYRSWQAALISQG